MKLNLTHWILPIATTLAFSMLANCGDGSSTTTHPQSSAPAASQTPGLPHLFPNLNLKGFITCKSPDNSAILTVHFPTGSERLGQNTFVAIDTNHDGNKDVHFQSRVGYSISNQNLWFRWGFVRSYILTLRQAKITLSQEISSNGIHGDTRAIRAFIILDGNESSPIRLNCDQSHT